VGPVVIPDSEMSGGDTSTILLTPMNLYSTKFRRGNFHTKDDAEGRDHIRFGLNSITRRTDGEKIISISCVLGGLK
jgi:hypothetical protein